MASTLAPKAHARPAHPQGLTHLVYTPDGTKLITIGSNNNIRLYKTGFDGEPDNIDKCPDEQLALTATNDFFIIGAEDGTVSQYSFASKAFEGYVTRCNGPVRDVALSPDGKWCAVASDDLTVRLVNVQDTLKTRTVDGHGKPTKHLAFDPKGSLLALACTDGVIYIYSLTADKPELIRKVEGVIGALDTASDMSARIAWHPEGLAFAVPTPTSNVQVISKNDWEKQRSFSDGHHAPLTALAWSPNGALLATAARDGKLLIWSTEDQSVIHRCEYKNAMDLAWHPTKNLLSIATTEGEVYICEDFLPEQWASKLRLPLQHAPFYHHPLAEISANVRRPDANGQKTIAQRPRRNSFTGSSDWNDLIEDLGNDYDDDFVVDDDGAGYTSGLGRKRPAEDDLEMGSNKRMNLMRPRYHEAFQPGSTPWRGNRKYLCLNLIGFVWTVDQDSHNTVTVEFYDHEFHRDFHFTDKFLYDKACLNEHGALFSCPPKDDTPATIFYRPHETWTHREDWLTELPKGEAVLSMSLSESFITVTTTANYVRVYTLFGIPYRVTRPKSSPMVTCASWRDYVMTVGNGPVGGDGNTRLCYTIENIKRDEMCQNEDTVALPDGAKLESVFFSDGGDPCIYDSTGVLLTLLHWRQPSKAYWVPLLDTKLLPRLASGRKSESYYPIAVADNKFHCIILKGGDKYPYFPRPLLSEFAFSIPLTSAPAADKPKKKKKAAARDGEDEDMLSNAENSDDEADENAAEDEAAESRKLEQTFLLRGLQATQLSDAVEATTSGRGSASQRAALQRLELDVDKALLQLLAVECREGEERGMRALEVVKLMRDRSGRMLEAAGKVAERYGRGLLGEKIREEGEKRIGGEFGDDEGEFE